MKLLCVRVRKSTRAVVQAPASEVVGTINSIQISSVMSGIQYSSLTGNRPTYIMCTVYIHHETQ